MRPTVSAARYAAVSRLTPRPAGGLAVAVPTLRIAQPTGDAALQEWRHIHNTIVPTRLLSPDDVRERSTRNLLHVGYTGEEAVGCTTVRPPADGSSTAVVIARVLAPHRGQGLGEQLYAFALERARELGAQTVETVVLATNEDGLRFAQRHGFAEFDRYVLPGDTVAFVELHRPMPARSPREVLARYQQAILDRSADDLADLYAPDAVHELPFLFPGMPDRYRGSEEVRAGYRAAWGASPARPQEIRDLVVHESTDPEVLTVEQTVVGTVTTDGRAFRFPGVLVLRIRDGRIVHVRDYMDGLGVARAMGRLDVVTAALGTGSA
jgi:uncharacterized protein